MVTKSQILVVVTYILMLFQLPPPRSPIFQPKYDMIFFYALKQGVGWQLGDVVIFCFEFVM